MPGPDGNMTRIGTEARISLQTHSRDRSMNWRVRFILHFYLCESYYQFDLLPHI